MIVLSGGIGSGKSVVAGILRLEGYGVFDCDYEAKEMMHNDPNLVKTIKGIVGDDIYDASGLLDKKKLASLIYTDASVRNTLNEVVHSQVRQKIREWLAETPKNIFVESAIAVQSGLAAMARGIWIVSASIPVRIARVKCRDGRNHDEIERIILAQAEEERLTVDFKGKVTVIDNDGSIPLLPQIFSALNAANIPLLHNQETT